MDKPIILRVGSYPQWDREPLDALETRKLGSAALGAFEGESKRNERFLALDTVLLQPHHASGTIETRKAMGQLVRDNLAAHFAGQPLLTPVL